MSKCLNPKQNNVNVKDVNNVRMAKSNCSSSTCSAMTPLETSITDPSDPTSGCHFVAMQSINNKYSLQSILKCKNYMPLKRLSKTLQGSIWKVSANEDNTNNNTFIVKVTDKSLHDQSVTYYNGNKIYIHENIVKEINILKYLSVRNPPNSLIKFIDCFCDDYNYFLVMEDGGDSLFDFTKQCHEFIKMGMIDIIEWRRFCKLAMQQMVNLLDWMHNTMKCCHLDLSLENFTIQNIHVKIMMNDTNKKIIFSNNFQVKLVDFGLAEVFKVKTDGQIDFRCNKHVGKRQYQAPEVYRKKHIFNAASADCWSLAVCCFMMCFGCQPFQKPSPSDDCFKLIMDGKLINLLMSWDLIQNASVNVLDLLLRLFCLEKYRLTIRQIKQHNAFN